MTETVRLDSLHSLLLQKKELVFQLLRMTNDTPLNEDTPEKNAEKYIGLIEAREEIVNELEKLNEEMRLFQLQAPASAQADMELDNILEQIRGLVAQLTRLENENNKKASDLAAHLQKELRDIKNRRNVCDKYDNAYPD